MTSIRKLIVSSLCGSMLVGCGVPGPDEQGEPAEQQTATHKDPLVIIPIPIFNYLYNPGFENADPVVPLYSGFIDHGSANAPWFAGWASAAETGRPPATISTTARWRRGSPMSATAPAATAC